MDENTYTPPPDRQPQPEEQPTAVLGEQPAAPRDEQPTAVLGGQPAPAAAPQPTVAQATVAPPTAGAAAGGYQPASSYPPPTAGYPPQGGYAPQGAWAPAPTTYAAPPPQGGFAAPSAPARRLLRSRSDRMIGGVCGGLARYWNTDPVLLRILTVVLTLATGGAFLIGYLIAWIAIPEEPMGPAPYGPAAGPAGVGYAAGGNPPYADLSYAAAPPPAPRERSYLGWLVLSVAVLVAGVLSLFGTLLPATAAAPGIVGGVALAILGIGLVVGTWYGRARWLTILAVPLALFTFAAVVAGAFIQANPNWDRWTVEGSQGQLEIGDRVWTVTPDDRADSPLDFRVSAGDAVLDLTALTALGDAPATDTRQRLEIEASVGVGQLRVVIPDDMQLELDASVDLGEISIPGEPVRSGADLDVTTTVAPVADGQPTYIITLDAALGAGNLEVLREAA